MINSEIAACYAYFYINKEELLIELELMDDIPEECPMNKEGGITFKIDPDYLEDEDDLDDFSDYEREK